MHMPHISMFEDSWIYQHWHVYIHVSVYVLNSKENTNRKRTDQTVTSGPLRGEEQGWFKWTNF